MQGKSQVWEHLQIFGNDSLSADLASVSTMTDNLCPLSQTQTHTIIILLAQIVRFTPLQNLVTLKE